MAGMQNLKLYQIMILVTELDILLLFNVQNVIQDYRENTELILNYQTEEI